MASKRKNVTLEKFFMRNSGYRYQVWRFFGWDCAGSGLCRFSGVGPFFHYPFYNNLLPNG